MSDEHLSDHEWRLKQAREGKAIYIPGKTTAQVKAERAAAAAAAAKMHTLSLDLSEADLEALDTALDDLAHTVRDAERVFTFLADGIGCRSIDPECPGLPAMMRLAALALRGMEDRELRTLGTLDNELRRQAQARAQARLKGGTS